MEGRPSIQRNHPSQQVDFFPNRTISLSRRRIQCRYIESIKCFVCGFVALLRSGGRPTESRVSIQKGTPSFCPFLDDGSVDNTRRDDLLTFRFD